MKKKRPIQGLTILEALNDLDDTLVADAEIPGAAPIPVVTPTTGRAGRFLRSGWLVATLCLLVSFGVVAAIVYAGRQVPDHKNPPPAGVVTDPPESTGPEASSVLGEGKIPFGQVEVNYTIRTEQTVYETTTRRLLIIAQGQNQGEAIPGYQTWAVESLTDPDWTAEFYWTEEAIEPRDPAPDEYATWRKAIHMGDGYWKPGIYRIHHMIHAGDELEYVSAAHCEFAIGEEWGELLENAWNGIPLPEDTTPADTTPTIPPADTSAESTPSVLPPPLDPAFTEAPEKPFTIRAEFARGEVNGVLTVTYTAVEPGVSLTDPPVGIALYRLSDDGQLIPLPRVGMFTTSEYIAEVEPTQANRWYATFSKIHMVQGQQYLTPGTYRVLSLDNEGRVIAYADLTIA